MKRILVVLAIVAAAAFVGASAGGATAAPSSVFCINGHTYTDPLGADFLTVAAGEGGYYAENDPEEFTSHEFLFEVYDGDEFLASDPDFDPTGLIFVPVSKQLENISMRVRAIISFHNERASLCSSTKWSDNSPVSKFSWLLFHL